MGTFGSSCESGVAVRVFGTIMGHEFVDVAGFFAVALVPVCIIGGVGARRAGKIWVGRQCCNMDAIRILGSWGSQVVWRSTHRPYTADAIAGLSRAWKGHTISGARDWCRGGILGTGAVAGFFNRRLGGVPTRGGLD